MDKCNVLLVVDKGVGEDGVVACFKFANNKDGLVCCELNNITKILYGMAVVL